MSRSGYTDDYGDDSPGQMNLYRAAVDRALKGKRGQQFLRELAEAMDAMPEKALIADELKDADGDFCALGVVGNARGLDMRNVDPEEANVVAKMFDIAESMAREIVFINDNDFCWSDDETPANRWTRVRKWIARHLNEPSTPAATPSGAIQEEAARNCCRHGIHFKNACGACVPPRGTTP